MRAALIALFLIAVAAPIATSAFAGNCDTASDRASDGSRCGDRAADRRDGGR
ncbi:transmembrane anchored protein [Hansschlegelia zhihuaiae]|uniref:Transmembrane anchored protein n=1 Tax=Hansschlegelia zhihuaiae TaxID=405005 RepID=A0A4Q0M2L3_9HYPH|nr:transmembrane anchored protein [Hansschlegelia zhihuaiae]